MAQSVATVGEFTATQFPTSVHGFAWGALVLTTLALVGISRAGRNRNVWEGWRESSELRRPAYAEQVYVNTVFRTRANTWSNLAYVLVGFYGLALAWHDLRHAPSIGRRIPRLTLGSRPRNLPTWPVSIVLVGVGSLLLFLYKWSLSLRNVLSTLIATVTLLAVLDLFRASGTLAVGWLGWSSAALLAAVICRQLDVAGRFTGPDAWLQGHALWHLLASLSPCNPPAISFTASSANCTRRQSARGWIRRQRRSETADTRKGLA